MVERSASSSGHGSGSGGRGGRLSGLDSGEEVSRCFQHDGFHPGTFVVVHRQQEVPQPDRATLDQVFEEM